MLSKQVLPQVSADGFRPKRLPYYKMTATRLELLCWPLSMICILLILPMSNNLPPISPSVTPQTLVQHYSAHLAGFRAGIVILLVGALIYPFYGIGVSNLFSTIPGVNMVMVMTQAAAGVALGTSSMISGIFLAFVTFRMDRDPALIQLLSDMAWLFYLLYVPIFYLQDFLITSIILSDRRDRPLLPRWLGWINYLLPVLWFGGFGTHCVHSGPFAWNGAITFWLAVASYAVQMFCNLPLFWIAAGEVPCDGDGQST